MMPSGSQGPHSSGNRVFQALASRRDPKLTRAWISLQRRAIHFPGIDLIEFPMLVRVDRNADKDAVFIDVFSSRDFTSKPLFDSRCSQKPDTSHAVIVHILNVVV
jgi:hypothetical protein